MPRALLQGLHRSRRYAEESVAVENFLATRGESRLVTLRSERDQASADLAFESAAELHVQVQRVEAVHALAAELVRPLSKLRAVILQACANLDEVAVFLFDSGRLRGPAAFTTLGMRIQNEQSGSTSLFAQPLAIEPIPEEQEPSHPSGQRSSAGVPGRNQGTEGAGKQGTGIREQGTEQSSTAARLARGVLESRLERRPSPRWREDGSSPGPAPSSTIRQGHLALLKRWYYRPEAKRAGEIFFPDAGNHWPIKSILRGIGRVAAKSILPPLQS